MEEEKKRPDNFPRRRTRLDRSADEYKLQAAIEMLKGVGGKGVNSSSVRVIVKFYFAQVALIYVDD